MKKKKEQKEEKKSISEKARNISVKALSETLAVADLVIDSGWAATKFTAKKTFKLVKGTASIWLDAEKQASIRRKEIKKTLNKK